MVVRAAHHLEMKQARDAAIGVVLRAARDVTVGVGADFADAYGVEIVLALVGEEFLKVFHRGAPQADFCWRMSAAADRTALMIGS